MRVDAGATSISQYFELVDAVTGQPISVTVTDLNLIYTRDKEVPASSNLTDLGSANAAFTASGAYEATSGTYRVDIPNAAFASGVDKVQLKVTHDTPGTTAPASIEVEIKPSAAFFPDVSSVINTGTEFANTFADTALANNTRWTIAAAAGDGGAGGNSNSDHTIDVICEMNLPPGRRATGVFVKGHFDRATGSFNVELYAQDYTSGAWYKLSSNGPTQQMEDASVDMNYLFPLKQQHTDPNTSPGEVKINFRSQRTGAAPPADKLYLDLVKLNTVIEGTPDHNEGAAAVAYHPVLTTDDDDTIGDFIRGLRLLSTTVNTQDTSTSFTLSAGSGFDNAYPGYTIVVYDASQDIFEHHRIETYTGATKTVVVDRAFAFNPAAGDRVFLASGAYGDVNIQAMAADVLTAIRNGLAVPGDEMNLVDAAITSAKHDESTSFPVKSVDSGSTEIARTGADSDTLETLSDQLDALSSPVNVDMKVNELIINET